MMTYNYNNIYLTYKYNRDVFKKEGDFKPWVRRILGDSVKFHEFNCGMSEPTLVLQLADFEKAKNSIPTKNLIKIQGRFNVLQYLSLGVRDFENEIK